MTPAANRRQLLSLRDAEEKICNADLLLWRQPGNLISIAGRGVYSHAAMAAWWGHRLMCLQARLRGIEAVTLESQVLRYPAMIDVFQANAAARWTEFDADGAVAAMRDKTGRRYAFFNLLRTAATHLALARLIVKAQTGNTELELGLPNGPEFCSQAVSSAIRCGGHVNVIPELADRFVEPDDLARCPFFAYRFSLLSP